MLLLGLVWDEGPDTVVFCTRASLAGCADCEVDVVFVEEVVTVFATGFA